MKKADNEIILDYILSYAKLAVNINIGGGTKRLNQHLEKLNDEMLKRNILTQEQINFLNI